MDNEHAHADTPAGPATAPATTCGWAVASLACALIGPFYLFPVGTILAILFGYVARADIRRSHGRLVGRGMAIAGLIIGYVSIGIIVALFGFRAVSGLALRWRLPFIP